MPQGPVAEGSDVLVELAALRVPDLAALAAAAASRETLAEVAERWRTSRIDAAAETAKSYRTDRINRTLAGPTNAEDRRARDRARGGPACVWLW